MEYQSPSGNGIMEFLKTKWYWVLGGVIGVYLAYKLLTQNSGASSSAATGTAVSYPVYGGGDATAQVAAAQVSAAQVAANQAIEIGKLALTATKDTNQSNVSIAGINADVSKHVADDQLLGLANTNASALAASLDANAKALLGLQDTNRTQLSEYGIQGQIASQQISAAQTVALATTAAQRDVSIAGISAEERITQQQIDAQHNIQDQIIAGINYGVYNKGGQGGSNQVAALAALEGAPAAAANAAAVSSVAANSNNSIGQILAGVSSVITSAGKVLLA
jgi:hypothetical protein